VTLIGLAAPVADFATPALLDVHATVYCGAVRGLPFACGAVRFVNVAFSVPLAVFVTAGCATFAGEPTMTGNDATEVGLVPRALFATTVHVYVFPVVAPVTVITAAVAPACAPVVVAPPLLDVQVAMKLVIAEPLLAGVAYVTLIGPVAVVVEPGAAVGWATGAGAPTTTAFDAADAGLLPRAFVATTLQV
jgi:hypothetical protein